MKVKGQLVKFRPRVEPVTIGLDEDGKPITVDVRSSRLGTFERVMAEMPEPEAPQVGVQRDDKGRVMKDERGIPLVIRNERDPAFVALVRERQRLISIAMIVEAVGDQWTFEAQRATFPAPMDYYRAVRREMEAAGIDHAAVALLDDVVARMLKPAAERAEVNEARSALGVEPLPAPAPGATGNR